MSGWRVSSYSTSGAACVEADGPWVTSSYSNNAQQLCVEVSVAPVVRVRDTKDRSRKGLAVSGRAWEGFIEGQKL